MPSISILNGTETLFTVTVASHVPSTDCPRLRVMMAKIASTVAKAGFALESGVVLRTCRLRDRIQLNRKYPRIILEIGIRRMNEEISL